MGSFAVCMPCLVPCLNRLRRQCCCKPCLVNVATASHLRPAIQEGPAGKILDLKGFFNQGEDIVYSLQAT